jgi:hypothetical protein
MYKQGAEPENVRLHTGLGKSGNRVIFPTPGDVGPLAQTIIFHNNSFLLQGNIVLD